MGIGMTRTQLILNLDAISWSGTRQSMQSNEKWIGYSLIDQFFFDFFPAFLVSDRVIITSKHDGNDDK
jgi:HSP90 family molecular chaperone